MSHTPSTDDRILVKDVSKFYSEVLGVNRVNLSIPAGITSLVGPNGSGKTTLMNLLTGLLQPTQGDISILGLRPGDSERLFRVVGYCTQFDAFPRGLTGFQFLVGFLRLFGYSGARCEQMAWDALTQVKLTDAAQRRIAGYSKGMRQRVKLAQAICHKPSVLILDEPLNGLDPMARAEVIDLFKDLAAKGLFVLISSHILHEVDMISDQVVLLDNGYVVAEGEIRGVREEVKEHPIQVMVRCDRPAEVASKVFEHEHVVEVKVHEDSHGLFIRTRDASQFYRLLNRIVLDSDIRIETVAPADEDVQSVYNYLIGNDGRSR